VIYILQKNPMTRKSIRALLLSLLIIPASLLSACGGGGGGGGAAPVTPVTPPPPINYSQISSGGASNCRIDGSTNALACWGANDVGQLGIGSAVTSTATATSVNLGTGKTAKQVAFGIDHACAILNDDSVSCWGSNIFGQIGQSSLTTSNSSIPIPVTGVSAKALALGDTHTCVITLTGAVQCWGSNSKGQLGVAVSSIADSSSPLTISGLTAKTIKSGFDHICAIADNDTVKCWGDNQYGQLGNASNADSFSPVGASGLTGVSSLATGAYHSCAATATAVSCWGHNNAGQLGSNASTDMNSPAQTSTSLSGVTQLVAGLSHTCALSGTTAVCWGSNASKQLSGTGAGGNSMVTVSLSSSPKSLSAGLNHTCAQDSNNHTYCWGAGTSGRLGANTSTDASTPVVVP
jgi:alpha-tubulin suppressor-like RCC1 family protein